MLFTWFRDLLARDAAANEKGPTEPAVAALSLSEPPRYPPADAGLQVLHPEAILAANADLLERLKIHAATSEQQFHEKFLGPLQRLADHVSVLPATATGLFSGNMGLFRAALETGFYSFQASDGRIFTGGEGVERRHALEGRWRYLCFLAGLFFPLGRTLERIVVADAAGQVWKRHFNGVTGWARTAGAQRLFVGWGATGSDDVIAPSKASLALVPVIVGAGNLQMLQDGSGDLVSSLYEIAAGDAGASRIAHQVVVGCWSRIERREAARRPQVFGRVTVGTQVGPYLVGAVRELVGSGRWNVNGDVLKADRDGLYLVWPAAAADLIAFGAGRGYAGWPADAATLAALLQSCSIVENLGSDFGLVEVVNDEGEIVTALKFVNPLAVLNEFDADAFATAPARTPESVLKADPPAAAEAVGRERAQESCAPAAPQQREVAEAEPPSPQQGAARSSQQDTAAPAAHDAFAAVECPEAGDANAAHRDDQHTGAAARAAQGDQPMVAPSALAGRSGGTSQRRARLDSAAADDEQPSKGKLKEAPDVRYSDLVPEDLRAQIRNPRFAEQLGKLIKGWRDRDSNNTVMRRIDTGIAIDLAHLVTLVNYPPPWLDAMADAGLIYVPPGMKGVKAQKLAMPENGRQANVVILSNLACKRLGL